MRLSMIRGLMAGVALGAIMAASARAADDSKPGLANPLFAFDNGTGRDQHVPPDEQAMMLKELGYAGIGYTGTQRIPEMLKALDAQGLKMFSIYVGANVDAGKPPYDPGLKAAIRQLKGRDTLIWVYVLGGRPSSADSDNRAVTILREIADMASESGLRVAMYPHVGFYVARVEDSVRLAKKVGRKNLGATFNLCHFLKLDNEKNLAQRLAEAMPYLFMVSINGADAGDTGAMPWNRLIQTLDRGSFDVGRVLRTLKQLGYTGPIGLQCYAIPGDCRENLTHSMKGWRHLCAAIAAER
jgi:sugar phosphate isomerase/epimerase